MGGGVSSHAVSAHGGGGGVSQLFIDGKKIANDVEGHLVLPKIVKPQGGSKKISKMQKIATSSNQKLPSIRKEP